MYSVAVNLLMTLSLSVPIRGT